MQLTAQLGFRDEGFIFCRAVDERQVGVLRANEIPLVWVKGVTRFRFLHLCRVQAVMRVTT